MRRTDNIAINITFLKLSVYRLMITITIQHKGVIRILAQYK